MPKEHYFLKIATAGMIRDYRDDCGQSRFICVTLPTREKCSEYLEKLFRIAEEYYENDLDFLNNHGSFFETDNLYYGHSDDTWAEIRPVKN